MLGRQSFPFQIPFLLWYLSLDIGVWNVGEVMGTKFGLTGMPGLVLAIVQEVLFYTSMCI